MQALAALQGRVRGSEERTGPAHIQRWLSGYAAFDDVFGGVERAQLTALDASTPMLWDLTLGTLCEGTRHGMVVAVDGGNSFDPYLIAAHARRLGMVPRDVLAGLRVSRAFTAYQLSVVLNEALPDELLDHRPGLVLVSCLPELYLDEDVPWHEANELVKQAMDGLRAVARDHGCAVLATNAGIGQLAARPRMRDLFYGADRVLRLLQLGESLVLEDWPRGHQVRLKIPARAQATLHRFDDAPLPPLARAPPQLMLKGAA